MKHFLYFSLSICYNDFTRKNSQFQETFHFPKGAPERSMSF